MGCVKPSSRVLSVPADFLGFRARLGPATSSVYPTVCTSLTLCIQIHMMARFITRKTAADKKRERARAAGASGTSTPVPANDSSSVPVGAARASVPFASDARIDDAEWTTHAVCVASYVCKHASSRRTLPPALVLAASGFGLGGTTDAWEKMQDIRYGPKKALRKFWSGGWAEGERWWEDLAGVWEAQRAAAARELSGTKA